MVIGDIVTRNSYNHDIEFVVDGISDHLILLSGLHYRLLADAPLEDLRLCTTKKEYVTSPKDTTDETTLISATTKDFFHNLLDWRNDLSSIPIPVHEYESTLLSNKSCFVKILHIDANERYLKKCLSEYKRLKVPVIGITMKEEKQAMCIQGTLDKYHPNILVITGHDSMQKTPYVPSDMNSYLNSKYFAESIKIARTYNRNYDDLVIIAGGCYSHYEALIKAGANFASSPNRSLINVLEPVSIACTIASTSVQTTLTMDYIIANAPTKVSGFGGIETRGQCRELKPSF